MTKAYRKNMIRLEASGRLPKPSTAPEGDFTLVMCSTCHQPLPRKSCRHFSSPKRFSGWICYPCDNKPKVRVAPSAIRPSPVEEEVIKMLKRFFFPFQREFPLSGAKFDFCIPDLKVLIEVDSASYHGTRKRRTRDWHKDEIAMAAGYGLIRVKACRGFASGLEKRLTALTLQEDPKDNAVP